MTITPDTDLATLEKDEHGLERLRVTAAGGEAVIYLLGAHITHWQPDCHEPVLWMSRKSEYRVGHPIRGGVPVIFPWFGLRPDDPEAPGHGFVRSELWELKQVTRLADGRAEVRLTGPTDPPHHPRWPHAYEIEMIYRVGPTLEMGLRVRNVDKAPFTFTEALHTYFAVSDIRSVTITGLEGSAYLSKVEGGEFKQPDAPIRFTAETDRVYRASEATVQIEDPGLSRRIVVAKQGSRSTVVWNPWIAKSVAIPDFDDDEWPDMLCVETANALEDGVTLAPGESHEMWASLEVERA